MFCFPREILLPDHQLLRHCLGPYHIPSPCGAVRLRSASDNEQIFPGLSLFFWQFFNLLTCWTSWVMPGHHAIILNDASVAFFNQVSQFSWNERNNTSEDDSIVYSQFIFVLFESFLRFWTMFFLFATFDSFHYVLEESLSFKFSFDFCLGH